MDTTLVTTLKPLYLETPLVAGGKAACSILAPEEPHYQELGNQVSQAIAKTLGGQPRVCSTLSEVDPARETVIALGQMINNKLIERLYWNRYVYIDSLCPGREGFVVQTVHNPYPWTGGHNVVVLGGSTFEGVRRAVEYFTGLLPSVKQTGKLDYTLKVQLPPSSERELGYVIGNNKVYTRITLPGHNLTEAETKALAETAPQASLLTFLDFAMKYLVTGETPYLQAGKRELETVAEVFDHDPARYPPWTEETNAFAILTAWDAVEEAPVFNDQERLRYTNTFLRFLFSLVGQIANYETVEKVTILHNHQTFGLLGLYGGGRYFKRYYNNTPVSTPQYGYHDSNSKGAYIKQRTACQGGVDVFLDKAAAAFAHQAKSWKPLCDADWYLTLTIKHTIMYELAEGHLPFFESGNIRKYADYLIGICDNYGWGAGFGDSGLNRHTDIPDLNIPYAFWYTKDPRYLGYLNGIHGGHWLNPYHQDVVPEPPTDLAGIHLYPLNRLVYEFNKDNKFYPEDTPHSLDLPYEQTFDKISFRTNFDPLGQYFLLDGYARGAHRHYDGNAIIKLADKGVDWLVDADYLVMATTDHNMVSVLYNGRAPDPVPAYAALIHLADWPSHGFTETMVRNYNGADWLRDIFWRKGDWIVVMDRLLAGKSGDYKFDCVFKCLDQGKEELVDPHHFRISRTGTSAPASAGATDSTGKQHQFFIVNADGATQYVIPQIGNNCGTVKRLIQRHSATLGSKQAVAFQNLLYVDEVGQAKNYSIKRLSDSAVLVRVEAPTLLGAGAFQNERLKVEAGLFRISAEKAHLVDGTSLCGRKPILTASAPVSIELDLKTSRVTVVAKQKAELRLEGVKSPWVVATGRQEITHPGLKAVSDELQTVLQELAKEETTGGVSTTKEVLSTVDRSSTAGRLQKLWQLDESEGTPEILDLTAADLKGDRRKALLVCRGSELQCYSADGKLAWKFPTKGTVHCVAVADVNGDGMPEIVCGGEDRQIHILDRNGKEKTQCKVTEAFDQGHGRITPLFPHCLTVSDLEGNGQKEIVVGFAGSAFSQISAFDRDLNRIWNTGPVYHGPGRVDAVDLDGDGRKEVLISDHYGSVGIFSADGKNRVETRSDMVATYFDVGDLNGDGKLELLNACDGGVLKAYSYSANATHELFGFSNYGYGFREVRAVDLDGDGRTEVLLASDTGYLYVLDGSGKVKQQYDLGSDILAMAISGSADGKAGGGVNKLQIVTGQRDGRVRLLDVQGKTVAQFDAGSPVKLLKCFDLNGDGHDEIIVVDQQNRCAVLKP